MFSFNRLKFIAASDYNIHTSSDLSGGAGPNQMPFHIGFGDSSDVYQNIIISNCYFDGVGCQKGVIYFNNNNTYKNISITNNISMRSVDTSLYTLAWDAGSVTYENFQEVNNMITDVSA